MDHPGRPIPRGDSYSGAPLLESEVHADPAEQFARWFAAARRPDIPEPNAMTVATAGEDGRPSARMMLLKSFEGSRFTFFTNFDSRKGSQLQANPHAALLFYWPPLHRQIRIEGAVTPIPDSEADAYFRTRPLESQLGAWASAQSSVLPNRDYLETRLQEKTTQFAGREVTRPPHWGGFCLVADRFEFWQGHEHRLHDRIEYERTVDGWRIQRLAP